MLTYAECTCLCFHACRQALTEEKLRKQTPLRSMSMPGGRGGAAAAAAAGGDVSSSRPWQRTNTSQPAKKWYVASHCLWHGCHCVS